MEADRSRRRIAVISPELSSDESGTCTIYILCRYPVEVAMEILMPVRQTPNCTGCRLPPTKNSPAPRPTGDPAAPFWGPRRRRGGAGKTPGLRSIRAAVEPWLEALLAFLFYGRTQWK